MNEYDLDLLNRTLTRNERARIASEQRDNEIMAGLTKKVKALEGALSVMAHRNRQLEDENRRLREAEAVGMVGYV